MKGLSHYPESGSYSMVINALCNYTIPRCMIFFLLLLTIPGRLAWEGKGNPGYSNCGLMRVVRLYPDLYWLYSSFAINYY